jgi:hypothetical protein
VICSPTTNPSLSQRSSVEGAIPSCVAALPVEDPGDFRIGVVHGEAAHEVDGVFVGADCGLWASQRDGQFAH